MGSDGKLLNDERIRLLPLPVRRLIARHSIRQYLYGLLIFVLVLLVFRWLTSPTRPPHFDPYRASVKQQQAQQAVGRVETRAPPGNVIQLDIYMEAQCPDTTRFIMKELWPTWQNLGTTRRVRLTLIPFGKARCHPKGDDDFTCQCQHGVTECELNQLMNCVMDQLPHVDLYLPFLHCIQGKSNLEEARRLCIDGHPELNGDRAMVCARGARGRQLLADAGRKTNALRPPLSFVPWVMLDGARVVDALYALQENICQRLSPVPSQCSATVH